MNLDLTQDRLKELLSYDPETGLFQWYAPRGYAASKEYAGSVHNLGYIKIKIDGVTYAAHRLAWLFVYGDFPPGEMDHVNGDRADNRIENLRLATRSQNMRNTRPRANKTAKHKGVSFCKQKGRWRAQISVEKEYHYLGRFATEEEAAAAYAEASERLHGDYRCAA